MDAAGAFANVAKRARRETGKRQVGKMEMLVKR
jgi:hypothetical protein